MDPRATKNCSFCRIAITTSEESHLPQCKAEFRCQYCGKFIPVGNKATHEARCGRAAVTQKCVFCSKNVPESEMPSHHPQCLRAWKCPKCSLFLLVDSMIAHQARCGFEERKTLVCALCQQKLSAAEVQTHENDCPANRNCPQCGLHMKVSLADHLQTCQVASLRRRTGEEPQTVTCQKCGAAVSLQGRLHAELNDHTMGHELQEKSLEAAKRGQAQAPVKFEKCDYCHIDVPQATRSVHQNTCPDRIICTKCRSAVSRDALEAHNKSCSSQSLRPIGLRSAQKGGVEESKVVSTGSRTIPAGYAPYPDPPHLAQQPVTRSAVQVRVNSSAPPAIQRPSAQSEAQKKQEQEEILRRMNSVVRHFAAVEDRYYSGENYDVKDIQELLKLDGDRYEPGKGLPETALEMIPSYQYQGGPLDCLICQEAVSLGEKVKKLQCGHVFHCVCIDQWLIRSPACPIDKSDPLAFT